MSAKALATSNGAQGVAGTANEPRRLLLVAACNGQRCRTLRQLREPTIAEPHGWKILRDAVRQRRNAILISTGCLGPCSYGSVVVLGWATMPRDPTPRDTLPPDSAATEDVAGENAAGAAAFRWCSSPVLVGLADRPRRATDLAGWIQGSAPQRQTMPSTLRQLDP